MRDLEFGAGYLKISADTIEIESSWTHYLKFCFKRGKFLIVSLFILAILLFALLVLYPYLYLQAMTAIIFSVPVVFLTSQRIKMWKSPRVTFEKSIPYDDIREVVYRERESNLKKLAFSRDEWFLNSVMNIVYEKNDEEKVRIISFAPPVLGGDEDFQRVKDAMTDYDIEMVPVDRKQESSD